MNQVSKKFEYTWEQAVEILRSDPQHKKLIYDSYLSADLEDNCRRYYESCEFAEVVKLTRELLPAAKRVLDLPAGNGIASYAFAKSGFEVVAVEPDSSATVGRNAIEYVKHREHLASIQTIAAYGESLPCQDEQFDLVFIRQGLHHAHDLQNMLSEAARVTKPGGLIIAAREPVVDDYERGLEEFLEAQPDHQLYGGENAFLHRDYVRAFRVNGISLLHDFGPYDSVINAASESIENVEEVLLNSRPGRILNVFLPSAIVTLLGFMVLRFRNKEQGRLHTFVGRKSMRSEANKNGASRLTTL